MDTGVRFVWSAIVSEVRELLKVKCREGFQQARNFHLVHVADFVRQQRE
jgi:hypothetical protein